jgi:catabolite repression protein CreC
MDNETSFVAPEGMYTMAEEHRPPPLHVHLPTTLPLYPTRLSTVIVKFPTPKTPSPGFTALLGGGGKGKEIERREKRGLSTNGAHEDSQSSSEQGEEVSPDPGDPDREKGTSTIPPPTSLFSPGSESGLSSKKSTRRPRHNIRTTSSSFVTRLQTTENLNKHLSLMSGDVTFLFYNFAKGFLWTELGTKAKVGFAPKIPKIYACSVSVDRIHWLG